MATNGGKIQYTIGFNVDKTGLQEIEKSLNVIKNLGKTDILNMNPALGSINNAASAMQKVRNSVSQIETAFKNAFDPTIGITNIAKLNQNLQSLNVDKIREDFMRIGPQGEKAFSQMASKAMTTNLQFKETNNILNKMGTTLKNTLKWTFSSSLINRFTGAIQQAVGYVEHLDSSLNDIRIVTKKSADEMEIFGQRANDAAKALGKATTDYTEAALIYYQQGLKDDDVQARAETTLKAANVTGQATKTVSEQLTAVWNGFRVNAEQTEEYVDKLAAVAAISASNLQELSTGMSKVASAASNLGVDIDQLNAQISTIISVTRQAPESVGTALKTIYARIGDLKLGDTDEDGLGLGDVSGGLKKLGVEVLDAQGELRDLGTVIEEVAAKWNTWTSAQQAAVAQLMAGKRQYNNLVALFSNWEMYEKAITTSRNATGELQKQQDIYMESTEAHLQKLKTEWEDIYDSIIDPDTIKDVADALTGVLSIVRQLIDAMGGGKGLLVGLGALVTRIFSKQIATNIENIVTKFKNAESNAAQLQAEIAITQKFAQGLGLNPKAVDDIVTLKQEMQQYYGVMSEEEIAHTNDLIKEAAEIAVIRDGWEAAAKTQDDYIKALSESQSLAGNRDTTNQNVQALDLINGDIDSKTYKDGLEAAEKVVKNAEDSIEEIRSAYENLINEIEEYRQALKDAGKDDTKRKQVIASHTAEIDRLKNEYKSAEDVYAQDANITSDQLTKIQAAYDKTTSAVDKLTDAYKKGSGHGGAVNSVVSAMKKQGEAIDEVTEKTREQTEAFRKNAAAATEGYQASKQQYENVKNGVKANNSAFDFRKTVKSITGVISSVSSLGFAFTSLSSITKTWEDDTLSAGEKVTQTFMSVGMVVGSVVSSIDSLSKALEGTKFLAGLKNIVKVAGAGNLAIAGSALAGIAGVVIGMNSAIQNQIEKIAEAATKAEDAAKKQTEVVEQQIDSVEKLKNEFDSLSEQYEENSITIKEFREKVYDLATQYGEEEIAIKSLTGSYKDLKNAILDLQDASEEEYIRSAKAEQEALENKLKNTIYRDLGSTEQDSVVYRGENRNTLDLEGFYSGNITTDNSFIQGLKDLGIQYYGFGQIDMEDLAHVLTYQYDDLEKLLNSSTEEGAIHLQRIIDEHKADIERAQALVDGQTKANEKLRNDELKQNAQTVQDQESAKKVYEAYIEKAVQENISLQEANQEFSKQALSLDNKYLRDIAEQNSLVAAVRNIVTDNHKFTSGTEITDKIKGQIKTLQDLGLDAEDLSILTNEDWKKFYTGDLTPEEIAQLIAERQKVALEQSRESFAESGLSETSSGIKSSITDVIEGSLDTTSEEFTKLLENLQEVKRLYPELTNEVETFSDTGLVGTEHWIQAAYDLQSALDKIEFNNLIKKSKDAKEGLFKTVGDTPQEEVQVIADDEQFQEAMEDIMNAEYQIDVEVHSDAERDFTQLVSSMEKADELASKIGEDFIVAADDIRDLNNAFPGILEGIEYLGDGTIQLNEEIVQSAMRAASQQEAASTEELTTKLNNAATELRAKAEVYDSMADIAHKAATQQIKSDEAKTQMAQKLNEIEAENDKIASQTEIDNAVAVADNSETNAEISAENWSKSYEQAANESYKFAQTAVQNAAAAAAGPNGNPVPPSNFGFTWSGKGGSTSSEAKAASGFQNASTADDWYNAEAMYRNMAEKARASANDIEGMMTGAAAKLQESVNKNLGVGKKSDTGKSSGGGKDADTEEYLEREEDIYRKINEELDQIESTLGRIDTMASHEWGYDYQKTLEEQNKLLDQQLKKLQEKNKLQVKDLATRRKQLEDVGVTFSEDGGVMNNAEQILNGLYAGYNSMVDKYNKMSASGQEAYKAHLETEKNRIDAIEKKIDEYESTYSDFQSTLDELQDVHYQQIENEVNQFNTMVDVHLELNDARKEWNTFWKEVIEDVQDTDFGGQVAASLKQLEVLTGLGGDISKSTIGLLTDQLNATVDEVNKQIATAAEGGVGSIFGDDSTKSKENLTNRINQLMSALRDAKSEVEAIGDNYIKQLEEEQKLVDKQADAWNAINKHLEHNIELIKLIDGEKAFDALNIQYEKQYENNLNSITTQRLATEDLEKKVKEYKEWMETAEKGSIEWQTASKAYDEAVENYIKATENLDSAIIKALNDLKEQTENANAKAIDTLDKAMSGGLGMDLVEEEWKLINDEANKYYDNVERYLNMEEYTNLLNDAANAIGLSAENQQKLNQFRDQELAQLNEKEQLTAYDIEESKARLEILKAQIALEDAQANKSKMRLRRDSQGNYNYQYVADESAVNEGENGVLTAKKSWYEIVKKRYQETSNEIINIQKQQLELATKIKDAEAAGDINRLNKYKEMYDRNAEYLENAMIQAENNKRHLYDGTAAYFANVENASILPQSEATVRKLVDEWAGEGRNSFVGAVKTAVTELDSIQAQFVQNSDKILTTANRNYQELKSKGIDPTLESLKDLAGTNDELADNMADVNEKLAEMAKNLGLAEAGYTTLKDSAAAALTEAQKSLETLAETYIQTQQKIKAAADSATSAPSIPYNQVTPSSSGGSGSGGSGSGGTGNLSSAIGSSTDNNTYLHIGGPSSAPGGQHPKYTIISGDGRIQSQGVLTDAIVTGWKQGGYRQFTNWDKEVNKQIGSYKIHKIRGNKYQDTYGSNKYYQFRSGGYTGEWGNDGRLAVLHQKELVLNEDDTKNMLSAVQILRSIPYSVIAQSLVNSSMNTASALSGINSGISGLSAAAGGDTTKTMVVNADFSGVHDADEIYQALVELENYGLQNSYSVAPHANSMY